MSEVVVGVDIGSSRIKAAAYEVSGQMVASAAVATPLIKRKDGDDFVVQSMIEGIGDVIRSLGCDEGAIVGVGAASMGEVGTIVGPDGLANIDFPSWYDGRGSALVDELERGFGAADLRDATGRHLRVASTVAKLGYAAARDGGLPQGTFVGICGALSWMLTGEVWQEAGLASTSGVYDLLGRTYLTDVWAAAGLGAVDLAPVHGPGTWFPATTAMALDLGIRPNAPIMIAGHDHPVAAVGSGATPGELVDSMGTGEAIIGVMQGARATSLDDHRTALDRDPLLSIEVWPVTAEPLVVWERLRPGLAMRSFLERSRHGRETLDGQAPPPRSPAVMNDQVSRALELGEAVELDYSAPMWAELVDFYVETANRGLQLVRDVTGSEGSVVLTGGGLRSPRWRASKALLGSGPMEVSTAIETGTRGCAAMVGATIGWWATPSSMPAAPRVPIRTGDVVSMERAAKLIR